MWQVIRQSVNYYVKTTTLLVSILLTELRNFHCFVHGDILLSPPEWTTFNVLLVQTELNLIVYCLAYCLNLSIQCYNAVFARDYEVEHVAPGLSYAVAIRLVFLTVYLK